MKKVITTKSFSCQIEIDRKNNNASGNSFFSGISKRSFWDIKQSSLAQAMQQLTDVCNQGQYEVQAMLPLTGAEAYEYAKADAQTWADGGYGWGIGQGWGVSMTNGFVALLQRIEQFTDEEYAAYLTRKVTLQQERQQLCEQYQQHLADTRKYGKQLRECEQQLQAYASQYEPLKAHVDNGVEERNIGLLKPKISYRYAEKQCNSRQEAEAMLSQDQARLTQLSQQYHSARAAREQLVEQQNRAYNLQKPPYDRIKQITIELGDEFSVKQK